MYTYNKKLETLDLSNKVPILLVRKESSELGKKRSLRERRTLAL